MSIKRNVIYITLLVLLSYNSFGQSAPDIDKKTYALYLSQNWDDLIDYSKNNIDLKQTDFFYLRMRLGTAYFENGDYLTAIKHFKKALSFYESSALAKKYLFYSYKYTFQNSLAKSSYKQIQVKNKKDIYPIKNKFFKSIKIETGINLSNSLDINKNRNLLGDYDIYGESKYVGNTNYFHFGLSHDLSDNLSVYHGISSFNIQNDKKFCFPDSDTIIDYNLSQTDYYLNTTYTFKNGLNLSLALHTMSVSFTDHIIEYNPTNYQYIFKESPVKFTDFLLYASVGKYYNKIYWQLGGSFSSINSRKQNQFELDISWLPFGNYKFVPGVKIVSYHESTLLDEPSISEIIFEPHATISLNNSIWINASYTFGDLYNYHENSGYIVYNNPDKTVEKAEAALNFILNKNITLTAKWRYMNRESKSTTYIDEENYIKNSFNFKTYYIIGGITWNL
ncbi:MAG: hypothetical protein U9R32_01240 [Bacteroidota bacterium]|nr:hypothetical protein [Bacteroidota bacterium]